MSITVSLIESANREGHSVRGIGVYTQNIKRYLEKMGVKFVRPTQHPDLIHYPQWDYLSSDWQYLLSRIPAIVTIHDVIPLQFPDRYPLGLRSIANLALNRLFLKNVKYVLTNSYASVTSIHQFLGIPHRKIKFSHFGIDPAYKPSKAKPKIDLPDKFALYTGDVNWNKNLISLTKACLSLKLPLVVVGKNALQIESLDTRHPELAHIPELVSLWKSPLIIRLGYVDTPDLALIVNLAKVYCQVSYAEGFGLPVLEALACGTPVVASHIPALTEVCSHQAYYCHPDNQDSIVSAIDKAIKSSSNQVLRRSRIDYAQKFSWEKTARDTLQVYNQALL